LQVVVSAHYVADEPTSRTPIHWPIIAQLSLPEAWTTDPARRTAVHVPTTLTFQTKPQVALALVDQARAWGVPFAWVVADAGYGDNPTFLKGLDDRQLAYVVGVSSTFGVRQPDEVRTIILQGCEVVVSPYCGAERRASAAPESGSGADAVRRRLQADVRGRLDELP
jgi:hypothetical protein